MGTKQAAAMVGDCLDGRRVNRVVDGVPLAFTRRLYPGQTFTWAEAHVGGRWVDLGDPWPAVTPAAKELRAAIAAATGQDGQQ